MNEQNTLEALLSELGLTEDSVLSNEEIIVNEICGISSRPDRDVGH